MTKANQTNKKGVGKMKKGKTIKTLKRRKTNLIVSSGQYETCAITVTVTHTTAPGLRRRARQLSREHAVYGDNWAGWIDASIAIAHPDDVWTDNTIIGGQNCSPVNEWLDLSDRVDESI